MFVKIVLVVFLAFQGISAREDVEALLEAVRKAVVTYQETSATNLKSAEEMFQVSLSENEDIADMVTANSSEIIDLNIALGLEEIEKLEKLATDLGVNIVVCAANGRENVELLITRLNEDLDGCTGNIIDQSKDIIQKDMAEFKEVADKTVDKVNGMIEECLGLEEEQFDCLNKAMNAIQGNIHSYPDYVINRVKQTQQLLVVIGNGLDLCEVRAGKQSQVLTAKIVGEVNTCLNNQIVPEPLH